MIGNKNVKSKHEPRIVCVNCISPIQIKRFRLNTGDMVKGIARNPSEEEKFPALIFVGEVNGQHPENAMKRKEVTHGK